MVEERRFRDRDERSGPLSLAALESIRLVLRGGSVVDWYRLNFDDDDEIRAFLSTLECDLENPQEAARVCRLRDDAARYLTEEHGYRMPDDVLAADGMDLFRFAAALKGRRRHRLFACLLLKIMHVLHHIEARELRYELPLSQSDLAQLAMAKVGAFAERLRAEGFPLIEYSGGQKSIESQLTKLLVKPEYHAASIRDRVRFRFVVEHASDLVPLMHRMTTSLIPFNYVLPGHSANHLVNFTALIESHTAYREKAEWFQVELGHEEQTMQPLNEFSGGSYRVINFVVDFPLRVPLDVELPVSASSQLGTSVFTLVEFQITDAQTAEENERGDNSHDAYKERQKQEVRTRLERGLRGDHAHKTQGAPPTDEEAAG